MGKKKPGKDKHTSAENQLHHNVTDPQISKSWLLLVFGLAFIAGILNRYHIASMFENDRHFSYLSDLEREMTFRTEMGLYYSYYKTLINAPSLRQGLDMIVNDNVTEFGHTINTLKRFNLYPELSIAWMYKLYMHVAKSYKIQTEQCWKTERGQGMEPVLSCEGLGNQFYFYINVVFALWGVVAAALFLYGVLLSDSVFGGLIAISSFFFNHGEATRVQWTPPLRESFGYPFCLLLMLLVTFIVKFKLSGPKWSVLIAVLTTCFMTSWQFSSFALSTQVGCIFVTYVLAYATSCSLKSIIAGFLFGFTASFILLFGNKMLLTSLFLSSLLTLQLILYAERIYKMLKFRLVIAFCQIVSFAVGTLLIKFAFGFIFNVKDDAHVFDILKSKFTNYSDFHTKLYTCAVEFDFMQDETPWKLTYTLLIPAVVLSLIFCAISFFKAEYKSLFSKPKDVTVRSNGEILYNILQLIVFSAMAIIIMRLKLFFTPHMCIFTSLLASKKILLDVFGTKMKVGWQKACCVLLIAAMAVEGVKNIKYQMSILGEYSSPNQERLYEWIANNTDKNAVFAGSMPSMANVKLSTGRPIVNHPHYEDAELRERTVKVYAIFSRKSHQEVFDSLKKMGVNYYIFEYVWCRKSTKLGCSMPELYDLDDVKNRDEEPLCHKIHLGDFGPFKLVYQNDHYKVLQIQ